MKKLRVLVILTFLFVLIPTIVNAAECDYAEQNRLNGLANNIKANFELKKGAIEGTDELDGNIVTAWIPTYDFYGSVYSITTDFYIKIKDSLNGGINTYSYNDAKEGVITFADLDPDKIIDYTIEVYSEPSGACGEKLIRTLKLTVPKMNEYRLFGICEDAPDYYLCEEYTTFSENLSEFEFLAKVQDHIDRKNKEKELQEKNNVKIFTKIIDFIKEYKYFFIIGVVVIGAGVPTTIIIIRKRRII